jgi:hypothetical protein
VRYLRLLFWLKGKLLLRGYRRSASEVVGTLVLVLIFLPISLGIAYFCGTKFLNASPQDSENLLRILLLGIYLFWLLTPMLGYSLNDSYDVTKLFVYPLSMRQIFSGALFGAILDRPTLLLLPTLLSIFIGYGSSLLSGIATLLAILLFLFHTLGLSLAILMAGAGVFQSRKFRDAAAVAIPAIWIVYYVIKNIMQGQGSGVDVGKAFLRSGTWEGLNYLPPGFAARAIVASQQGHYGEVVLYLSILGGMTCGTIYLASWLLQKIYAGETLSTPSSRQVHKPALAISDSVSTATSSALSGSSILSTAAPQSTSTAPSSASHAVDAAKKPARPGKVASALLQMLPPVVRAMLIKEFHYIQRDPYYKIILVNLIYPILLPIFVSVQGRVGGGVYLGSIGWFAAGLMTLSQMQLCCNIFGVEGSAITLLFLFPCPRKQILIGKNLSLFLFLSLLNLLFVISIGVFTRQISQLGVLLCWAELSLIMNLAVGNLFSIYFPLRVVMRGWRVKPPKTGRGCAYGLLYMMVMALNFVILIPVMAALLVPTSRWLGVDSLWLGLTIPLAVTYVLGIYAFALYIAEPLLIRREIEITGKVSQEES